MNTFHVPDMSCGHCTKAIEQAIAEADSAASVACDLETHMVRVNSTLPAAALAAALKNAGYPAVLAV